MDLSKITFFERFEADILSGKKIITIRDESESGYISDSIVQVSTFEDDRWFCELKILSVTPITFRELSEFHAEQENMTLDELKSIIQEIYPGIDKLYVIAYQRVGC